MPSSIASDVPPIPPFEGPEKLLEVWFAPSPEHLPTPRPPPPASDEDTSNIEEGERQRGKERPLGLLSAEPERWEEMLDAVKCRVLSVMRGRGVDAYLLSESSMFVYPHKLILKTCGTTTLLFGLPAMMKIAAECFGIPSTQALPVTTTSLESTSTSPLNANSSGVPIWRAFYSRKTFMFPEKQEGPHRDWKDEVKFLEGFFGNGSAYTVGRMNGDHWLLYLTLPQAPSAIPPSSPRKLPPASLRPLPSTSEDPHHHSAPPPDQTLEILMSDLEDSSCINFFAPPDSNNENIESEIDDGHLIGSQISTRLGIDTIANSIPSSEKHGLKTVLDSYLFRPCGYSANGLIRGNNQTSTTNPSEPPDGEKNNEEEEIEEDHYFSIHVTPSPSSHTYASFETNQVLTTSSDLKQLVSKVVSTFRPGRVCVTLFVGQDQEPSSWSVEGAEEDGVGGSESGREPTTMVRQKPSEAGFALAALEVEGYERKDRIKYEFEDYDLFFGTWEKPPSFKSATTTSESLRATMGGEDEAVQKNADRP